MRIIILILILIPYLIFAQAELMILMGDAPAQVETVWVDTIITFPFDANVTGLTGESSTVEFQASHEGKTGVCKMTIGAASDSYFRFSPTADASRELKLQFDIFVPLTNADAQIYIINLGYQEIGFLDGTAGAWITIEELFTTASGLTQSRFYGSHNNNTGGLTVGDVYYFDNIRILGKAE